MNDGEPRRGVRGPSWWLAIAIVAVAALLILAGVFWAQGVPWPPSLAEPTPGSVAGAPATPPGGGITGIFIEPGDGRAPILDEFDAARDTIDLEVYIVTDEEILEALERAQRRGVAVRVMLEEHPFGGSGGQREIFARLQEAGIAVRWGNPIFRFTHIKTAIVDNAVAIIMNQNLTTSAFTTNRDFGVVTTRPAAVRAAAAIFAADWERGAEPAPGPLVVSPSNARQALLELIASADASLDLYAEVVRDPEIVAALADAARRGVTVRLVLSPSSEFDAELTTLEEAGVEVRLMSTLYVHAKAIIADNQRAFVGSQNLSATSLDQNRELGIILDDPVSLARLIRTFTIDFQAGRIRNVP